VVLPLLAALLPDLRCTIRDASPENAPPCEVSLLPENFFHPLHRKRKGCRICMVVAVAPGFAASQARGNHTSLLCHNVEADQGGHRQ
jgi:hypothetical protein